MRDASSGLIALLDSQEFLKCNLYTFTLMSGSTYYWTDADTDVIADGITYLSTGPSFSGFTYKISRGVSVDEFDLTVLPASGDTLDGITWNTAARNNALTNASVKIDKAFLASWASPAEVLPAIFLGYVSHTSPLDISIALHVVSFADRLNTQIPRQLFQSTCVRSLYSPDCTVLRSSYQVSGSITTATDRVSFSTTLSQSDDYFNLGDIVFFSGANTGARRSIKSYKNSGGALTLSYPLQNNTAPSDTFIIAPGCDKTRGNNGCTKFSNTSNFKGMPYLPTPTVVTS